MTLYRPIKNKRIESVIDDLLDEYQQEHRTPWIIGFSGGKDSTVLLTLVWIAMIRYRNNGGTLQRDVFVVCNDTLVENPIISSYVSDVLELIKNAAVSQELPIQVIETTPDVKESFWVNVIGKGYPVPNNTFRWCTDRLKIKPTSTFLRNTVSESGEAIVLLGTRYSESSTRKKSMKKHERKNRRLSKHSTSEGTLVYAPIKELELEEVWYIINAVKSPWDFDNKILFDIYLEASADDYECPTVVTNKSHKSCGQSRFGCWTCTVVKEDKSMAALAESSHPWLKHLLVLRNQLQEERNDSANRQSKRRNGQIALNEDGSNMGAYSFQYRQSILRRLVQIQADLFDKGKDLKLITSQELNAIQVIWDRDGFSSPRVLDICNQTTSEKDQNDILNDVFENKLGSAELISELLSIQSNKSLLIKKRGLASDFESIIEKYIDGK